MSKLHPLHTVEMITTMIGDTGEYFDQNRRTGRSTALALKYIADAYAKPYTPIKVIDHEQSNGMPATMDSNRVLSLKVFSMIDALGLKHFRCNGSQHTVTFGLPSQTPVKPTQAAPVKTQQSPPAPRIPSLRESAQAWEQAFIASRGKGSGFLYGRS